MRRHVPLRLPLLLVAAILVSGCGSSAGTGLDAGAAGSLQAVVTQARDAAGSGDRGALRRALGELSGRVLALQRQGALRPAQVAVLETEIAQARARASVELPAPRPAPATGAPAPVTPAPAPVPPGAGRLPPGKAKGHGPHGHGAGDGGGDGGD